MELKNQILLITNDRRRKLPKMLGLAANRMEKKVVMAAPDFQALERVLNDEFGVVVLSHEEIGKVADRFWRAIRTSHNDTPVILITQKRTFLEHFITEKTEGVLSVDTIIPIINKSLEWQRTFEMRKAFINGKYEAIKNLTGAELDSAIKKIYEEADEIDINVESMPKASYKPQTQYTELGHCN